MWANYSSLMGRLTFTFVPNFKSFVIDLNFGLQRTRKTSLSPSDSYFSGTFDASLGPELSSAIALRTMLSFRKFRLLIKFIAKLDKKFRKQSAVLLLKKIFISEGASTLDTSQLGFSLRSEVSRKNIWWSNWYVLDNRLRHVESRRSFRIFF